MPRLIVTEFSFIEKGTYWRSGCILKYDDNVVRIAADDETNRLSISVVGPEATRKGALREARRAIERLNSRFPRAKVVEMIAHPEHPSSLLPVSDVKASIADGQPRITLPGGHPIDIERLIGQYDVLDLKIEIRRGKNGALLPVDDTAPENKAVLANIDLAVERTEKIWGFGAWLVETVIVSAIVICILRLRGGWASNEQFTLVWVVVSGGIAKLFDVLKWPVGPVAFGKRMGTRKRTELMTMLGQKGSKL